MLRKRAMKNPKRERVIAIAREIEKEKGRKKRQRKENVRRENKMSSLVTNHFYERYHNRM